MLCHLREPSICSKLSTHELNKKIVKNTGQMTQYHVKGSHPAIVTEEMYDLVQEELKKRKASQRRHYSASISTSRIFCGECGRVYGSKVQHSNDKYRRVVYICNGKYADKSHFCTTPSLRESQIKDAFVKAINKLESHKDEVIGNIENMKSTVLATDALQTELDRLDIEIEVLKEQILIRRGLISCVDYYMEKSHYVTLFQS